MYKYYTAFNSQHDNIKYSQIIYNTIDSMTQVESIKEKNIICAHIMHIHCDHVIVRSHVMSSLVMIFCRCDICHFMLHVS